MTKKRTSTSIATSESPTSFLNKWGRWILLAFGFLLYANTLGHDYTQDDAIVIYDNMYTVKGFAGIPGLLTKDTFYGFFKEEGKANLVSGGRYRPFTPIMFAVEYQLFGKRPMIGHFINALLYGLLGLCIFVLLNRIFSFRNDFTAHFEWVVFACAILFVAHPVHTEAVANIKGRDEIMSMLGAIVATLFIVKNIEPNSRKYTLFSFVSFLIALLSKENAITFLAIIPIILYFFYQQKTPAVLKSMLPVFVATIVFLLMRTAVLGFDMGGSPTELMNNPFLKLVNGQYVAFTFFEKSATILYTLGKYLMLLILPHPLTSDYYPRHIDRMSFADLGVLMSLFIYLLLIVLAVYYYKKDRLITFCIVYFLATLSIVSNVVFPIGTNMSERFLFMPSLGFCLLLPALLYKATKKGLTAFYITAVLAGIFSVKTLTRNTVWKNDFTLFTTDVTVSKNSAKILNAAGGALSTEAPKEKNASKKEAMLRKALGYLTQATKIHPGYKNAYLLTGNCHFYLNEFDKSIASYKKALDIDPGFKDAYNNLAVAYRDAGRFAGEKQNNLIAAQAYLNKSYEMNPKDTETLRLLGIAYGIGGQHQQALPFFQKVVELEPKNAGAFLNLSNAYKYLGDIVNATKYKEMALKIDPNVESKK